LQKLDARDRLSEVVLVPPAAEDEEVPVDGEEPVLEVVGEAPADAAPEA
jgi:DNA gyrase subunit A